MSEHYLVRCTGCKAIIEQCRCPGPKTERAGLCGGDACMHEPQGVRCGEKLTLLCDLSRGHAGPHWEDERPALRAEVEMYRKAEKDTSDAYVRLREIIGALRTVPGEDHIAHTEKIARTLVADRDREKAKVEQLIAYGTAERVRADALAVEVERLRAAIEAAPHGEGCACGLPVVRGNDLNLTIEMNATFACNCWKSKALEGSAR